MLSWVKNTKTLVKQLSQQLVIAILSSTRAIPKSIFLPFKFKLELDINLNEHYKYKFVKNLVPNCIRCNSTILLYLF